MILGLENRLIRHIPSIFEPTMVSKMSDQVVSAMGAETRAVRNERQMLQKDLEVLEGGLRECKKFKPRTIAGMLIPSPASSAYIHTV